MVTLEMLTGLDIEGYRLYYTDVLRCIDYICRYNVSNKWNK